MSDKYIEVGDIPKHQRKEKRKKFWRKVGGVAKKTVSTTAKATGKGLYYTGMGIAEVSKGVARASTSPSAKKGYKAVGTGFMNWGASMYGKPPRRTVKRRKKKTKQKVQVVYVQAPQKKKRRRTIRREPQMQGYGFPF